MKQVVAAIALMLAGCDYAERPHRGIPEHFKAETLTGETIDRDTLKGQPWVINVWVPGCGSCTHELPEIEALRQRYESKGVGFLAISMEPDAKEVIAAAQAYNIGSKVAIARSEMLGPLAVNNIPSTAFLRSDGILNAVTSGPKDSAWFERRIEEILPAQ